MATETPLRILIAGGGTGGHIIPALAIARQLRDHAGAEVRFVGTPRGLEGRLVPEAGFALDLIHVGQLKNVSIATRMRTLTDLPRGLLRCIALLRDFCPQAVVGVGGYASGPAMMAAILLGIPTLAFEPNAVPGLANRLVGRFVTAAAVNFQRTTRYFRQATVTGIPVRADFFKIPPPAPEAAPHLLLFGGSQGARVFNEVLPKIVQRLLDHVPGLTILHQVGTGHAETTRAAYTASGADPLRWQVEEYLNEMPLHFSKASLILCRSGASTVAELAAAGRASVLVPFPGAADDHQAKNAEVLQAAGAAHLRVQPAAYSLLEEPLLDDLTTLLLDPERCAAMGRLAGTLANPDAVEEIAAMVLGLTHKKAG